MSASKPSSGPRNMAIGSSSRKIRSSSDVADRRVGGQPQRRLAADVADVVGARRSCSAGARAVVDGRAQADADARRARQRPDQADEGQRPVDAAELPVARAEVDDLQRRAVGVGDLGAQDRGVAQIGLAGLGRVLDLDRPEALGVLVGRVAAAQQGARRTGRRPPAARRPRRSGPPRRSGRSPRSCRSGTAPGSGSRRVRPWLRTCCPERPAAVRQGLTRLG